MSMLYFIGEIYFSFSYLPPCSPTHKINLLVLLYAFSDILSYAMLR